MTEDDPCPLKAGGEASPELVRALRALGRSNVDSARLARVAEKLGSALRDVPPPGSSSTGWRTWFGAKTLISLVFGVAVLSVFGYRIFSQRPQISLSAASAPTATESSRTIAVVERVTEPPLRAVDSPSAEPEPARRLKHSPIAARSTRSAIPQPAQSTQPSQPTEVAPPAAPTPDAPVASHDSPLVQPAASTETRPAAVEAQPESLNLGPDAPRSELELLFDARKALPTQPTAALRLLDEHAARFPRGMLAPEREVLAIEALRTLGRTTEATQRLRRFQSQFPESIHLRRLAGNPGG